MAGTPVPFVNAVNTIFNADGNAVGTNVAFSVVLADQGGNKFTLAPGLVALPVSSDGLKATYYYSLLGFSPAATPTDIIQIQGSATKTVRVRRIRLGGVATSAANMPCQLFRRSAADTGGTPTAITTVQADTSDPAPTAVLNSFAANPSPLGAQVGGIMRAGRVMLASASAGVAANALEWQMDIKAGVLRGTSQFLCINMSGAALPTGSVFDIEIVTEEDVS
jgi:hypothetical protein